MVKSCASVRGHLLQSMETSDVTIEGGCSIGSYSWMNGRYNLGKGYCSWSEGTSEVKKRRMGKSGWRNMFRGS